MINGYTKEEICMLYREAKNKDLQITILTQLTGLRAFEVERILKEGGYLVADLERLKELHAEGLTIAEIAQELGLAWSTVSYHVKKLGLEPNGKGIKKKEVMKEVKKIIYDEPNEKTEDDQFLKDLKEETKANLEELKDVLPVPEPEPVWNELTTESFTPQQVFELAKLTLELLKVIWE